VGDGDAEVDDSTGTGTRRGAGAWSPTEVVSWCRVDRDFRGGETGNRDGGGWLGTKTSV
jgi:hypothetical protein